MGGVVYFDHMNDENVSAPVDHTPNDKDEILAAVAEGFAAMQAHIDEKVQSLEDRQLFLERKIDNRFDLLERMMHSDRQSDRDAARELAVRVSKLETASIQ